MLEIDGSRYSGSGTIVRQTVAFAALTGRAVHLVNIRARRPKPGLRRQHLQAVEALRQLSNGATEGAVAGSRDLIFRPGEAKRKAHYTWDIGSAGSTTALALATLPVLAFGTSPVSAEIIGGLFQDFAPSFYHIEHVIVPFLQRMGLDVAVEMRRPGYVPTGGGILHIEVAPARAPLRPLVLENAGTVERIWGIALSSRLKQQAVSDRMAESARRVFLDAGYEADIRPAYDEQATQPGAALAAFADLSNGSRLGADRAGAPRRRSETIGVGVARQLLEDLRSGAAIDRYASDQMIPFAALASGESRFRVPRVSDHIESNAWLCRELLDADVDVRTCEIIVKGVGWSGTG